MHIKIIQFMYGEFEYFALNEKINRVYCERHDYEYVIDREMPRTDRHIHWHKVEICSKYLCDCDYLFFLDADAFFYAQELSVEKHCFPLLGDKKVLLANDTAHATLQWNAHLPNMGTILIRNEPVTRQMMDEWNRSTDNDAEIRSVWPLEQLGFWKYILPKYFDDIQILQDYYLFGGVYGLYIRHLMLMNSDERAKQMKDYINIYLR